MQCCELHQRHTPINPAVIHAEINNNPAHSSTQPDQIWAQIIRGEVIFMREDSRSLPKKGKIWHNFRSTLTDIYKNWWQKWTNYKTGLHDQAQDPALLQLTLVMLLLLSRDNPPEVSISAPHLCFCLWPSMIILSPGRSPEDFLFLVQQRVWCTRQNSSSLLLSQQQVCWGFPIHQSALISQLSSHDDNLLTHDVVQWCLCLFIISFFSPQSHTFSYRKYTFSDVRLWLWSPLFYVERTRCYKH